MGAESGLCTRCGKVPRIPGERFCPTCKPYDPKRAEWSKLCTPLAFAQIYQPWGATHWGWVADKDRAGDIRYGLDVELTRPGRPPLLIAERWRGHRWLGQGITYRHASLWTPGKYLETVKGIARFFVYGWADTDRPAPPTRLVDWLIILNWELLERYHDGLLKPEMEKKNTDGSSTFLVFGIAELTRQKLVVARQGWAVQGPLWDLLKP